MSAHENINATSVSPAAKQIGLQIEEKSRKDEQKALSHLLVVAQLLMQLQEKAKEPTKDSKALPLEKPTTAPINLQKPALNLDGPALPDLPPALAKDMAAWFQSLERYNELLAEIKELSKKKNVHNMGMFIMNIMSLDMEAQGAKVQMLSAASNVATDMRNIVGDAINQFNGMAGAKSNDPKLAAMAKKFTEDIDELQAFLKYEGDLPKDKQVMSGDTVKQLLDSIGTVKTPFNTEWNNPNAVGKIINSMGHNDKTFNPQYKSMQDSFNTLNQSVSAFSTSTNTSLNFEVQNVKQLMGIEESEEQSILKSTSASVRNQRSS